MMIREKKSPALLAQNAVALRSVGRPKKSKNCSPRTISSKRGETTEYIINRLKRDHPEILKEVEDGKIKSAKAAGRKAGFIDPLPTKYETAIKSLKGLTKPELKKLAAAIETLLSA